MNLELVKYMLDGVLLALLLGIAGLLVWFHLRLNKLMLNYSKMPNLSELFGGELLKVKDGVHSLSDKIGEQVQEAGKTVQEIEYVLDRAEKVMLQFDIKLQDAKKQNIKPVASNSKLSAPVAKRVEPIPTTKQAVLPKNVSPKIIKQKVIETEDVGKPIDSIRQSLAGRSLGGISKKIRAFKPKHVEKNAGILFKNTTVKGGSSAYGAAAAIQKVGGGKQLGVEQEEDLIRALKERI